MKSNLYQRSIITFLLIIGLALTGLAYYLGSRSTQSTNSIDIIEHEDLWSWSGNYSCLDGKLQQSLNPNNDYLTLAVQTESGSISIKVTDLNEDKIIFQENEIPTETFTLDIPQAVNILIEADSHQGSFNIQNQLLLNQDAGHIYLYGEEHAVKDILEAELNLWEEHYQSGLRNLFLEMPYYSAQYLNLWMGTEDDQILQELFNDWKGTASDSEDVKQFFQAIKSRYPQTVFHGTDVGHQYDTTGERYLAYLRAHDQEDSQQYRLAQKNMAQGKYYYDHEDEVYRENTLTQNLVRELNELSGADIMGIYGASHANFETLDYSPNKVASMASQLREDYGAKVTSQDLTVKIPD